MCDSLGRERQPVVHLTIGARARLRPVARHVSGPPGRGARVGRGVGYGSLCRPRGNRRRVRRGCAVRSDPKAAKAASGAARRVEMEPVPRRGASRRAGVPCEPDRRDFRTRRRRRAVLIWRGRARPTSGACARLCVVDRGAVGACSSRPRGRRPGCASCCSRAGGGPRLARVTGWSRAAYLRAAGYAAPVLDATKKGAGDANCDCDRCTVAIPGGAGAMPAVSRPHLGGAATKAVAGAAFSPRPVCGRAPGKPSFRLGKLEAAPWGGLRAAGATMREVW